MSTPRRIVVKKPGGIEAMSLDSLGAQVPGDGEVVVRHTAIGVNFIDVYFRQGLYPWPDDELIPGAEAAGVIEEIGANVDGFRVGDRVAYTLATGAYASHRTVPASQLVVLPPDIETEVAAAVMLKGLTVAYLVTHSYAAREGDTVLFHAAAGGVGSLAGQWLKSLGVTTIGTAGGSEKCERARRLGYDHVIDYRSEDFVERVDAITQGRGVAAVYDSVGKDTVAGSLKCLSRFGTLVCFGQSSGPVADFSIGDLAGGSLRLTRPTLFHHTSDRGWLERASRQLFSLIESETLSVDINQRFALDEAADAHAALESRRTTGSTLLMP